MTDPLLYEQKDHVVTLTLNRHDTRNAISSDEMVDAIAVSYTHLTLPTKRIV